MSKKKELLAKLNEWGFKADFIDCHVCGMQTTIELDRDDKYICDNCGLTVAKSGSSVSVVGVDGQLLKKYYKGRDYKSTSELFDLLRKDGFNITRKPVLVVD